MVNNEKYIDCAIKIFLVNLIVGQIVTEKITFIFYVGILHNIYKDDLTNIVITIFLIH